MPPAYTPQQRAAIQQYAQFAKVKDSVAAKALKATNWDVSAALDEYYNKAPKAPAANLAPAINAVFDEYRDDAAHSPDSIGVEGTMSFLSAIGITLEEPASVAIHHLTGAESMGELERPKFVSGWEARGAGDLNAMKESAANIRSALSTDKDYYRTVYRHCFLLGRAPGQKSAQLETAIELWRLMLGSNDAGAMPWRTKDVNWIELWLNFIQSKGPKVVSKDLWNQTEVFARKSMDDEKLGFWSEESSWPTVIDEFVSHIKEKGTAMEVE